MDLSKRQINVKGGKFVNEGRNGVKKLTGEKTERIRSKPR